MAFKKATPIGLRARISLEGMSGSGKTTTALKIAQGLVEGTGKRIALICTEKGRARLEVGWADFDIDELDGDRLAPEAFVKSILESYEHGVLIVDSMSAEWAEVMQLKDAQPSADRFKGWARINPRHEAVVAAILRHPGHTISCFRSKMKHEVDEAAKTVKKIGVEPIARPGSEYDYDLAFSIDHSHTLTMSKPARGLYSEVFGEFFTRKAPGPELGKLIRDCLAGVADLPLPDHPPAPVETFELVKAEIVELGSRLPQAVATKVRAGRRLTNLEVAKALRDDLAYAVEHYRPDKGDGSVFAGGPPDRSPPPAEAPPKEEPPPPKQERKRGDRDRWTIAGFGLLAKHAGMDVADVADFLVTHFQKESVASLTDDQLQEACRLISDEVGSPDQETGDPAHHSMVEGGPEDRP